MNYFAYAAYTKAQPSAGGPIIKDPNLKALRLATSMAFLGPNYILVLQNKPKPRDLISIL
jgi:hypothetical protein